MDFYLTAWQDRLLAHMKERGATSMDFGVACQAALLSDYDRLLITNEYKKLVEAAKHLPALQMYTVGSVVKLRIKKTPPAVIPSPRTVTPVMAPRHDDPSARLDKLQPTKEQDGERFTGATLCKPAAPSRSDGSRAMNKHALLDMAACGSRDAGVLGTVFAPTGERTVAALNTAEPFCLIAVGVQGAGKSHTLGVVLEDCLLDEKPVVNLSAPITSLVFHFDKNNKNVCEAVGLTKLVPNFASRKTKGVDPKRVLVLVSPTFYLQQKRFYSGDYDVQPLTLSWERLSADDLLVLMGISEDDKQLYIQTLLTMLRSYQRKDELPDFNGFCAQIKEACSANKSQSDPLQQRLTILSSIVREADINAKFRGDGLGLDLSDEATLAKYDLILADMSDPLMTPADANNIFLILLRQFRACGNGNRGKLVVMDEAHKYLSGTKQDGLSNAIVDSVRQMRHEGIRLAISTQSPKVVNPEILELASICVVHRFHSRDMFSFLHKKIPVSDADFDMVRSLEAGEALVFASRTRMDGCGDSSVFHMSIRKRMTSDWGASRTTTQPSQGGAEVDEGNGDEDNVKIFAERPSTSPAANLQTSLPPRAPAAVKPASPFTSEHAERINRLVSRLTAMRATA